jgi:cell division protein FtsB
LSLKKLRKWLIYGAGLAVMILMLWDLVFSKHGYFVFEQEKQAQQQLSQDIKALKAEKKKLQQEVIRLREDPKAWKK